MPGELLGLLGMLLTAAAVLALAWLCTRYLAGRGAGGFSAPRGRGKLRLLEQQRLGKDAGVAVVRVGERYFLLGITPASVTRLAELSAEEGAAWQAGEDADGVSAPFREALAQALKRGRK